MRIIFNLGFDETRKEDYGFKKDKRINSRNGFWYNDLDFGTEKDRRKFRIRQGIQKVKEKIKNPFSRNRTNVNKDRSDY